MKLFTFILIIALNSVSGSLYSQTKIGDVILPDQLNTDGLQLVLNGGGIREKLWFDLYVGGLYLIGKSQDYNRIIKVDEPMAVRMQIISSMITSDRMAEAINEGFEKSTDGNIQPVRERIDKLITTFKEEIKIGDIFDLVYFPGTGVKVYKNQELRTTITGLDFKKALFGIWLSDDPVDKGLKKGMLGQK